MAVAVPNFQRRQDSRSPLIFPKAAVRDRLQWVGNTPSLMGAAGQELPVGFQTQSPTKLPLERPVGLRGSSGLDDWHEGAEIGTQGSFDAVAPHDVLRVIVGNPDLGVGVLPREHLERQIEPHGGDL